MEFIDTFGARPATINPKEWALVNCIFSKNYLFHRRVELTRELANIETQLSNLEKNMARIGKL